MLDRIEEDTEELIRCDPWGVFCAAARNENLLLAKRAISYIGSLRTLPATDVNPGVPEGGDKQSRLPDSSTLFSMEEMEVRFAEQAPPIWLWAFWRAQSEVSKSADCVSQNPSRLFSISTRGPLADTSARSAIHLLVRSQ
jgi:hypothetical protein